MQTKELNEKLLELIPEHLQQLADDTIQKIIFLEGTLINLEKDVIENGEIVLFVNGKQQYHKENPALKSYRDNVKLINSLVKQLTEFLPKETEKEEVNELMEFLKGSLTHAV